MTNHKLAVYLMLPCVPFILAWTFLREVISGAHSGWLAMKGEWESVVDHWRTRNDQQT